METSSKKLDDAKVEITVKVPANDVDNEFKNVYKEAGNVRIPGFRKGRAPRKILENAYGGKDYFRAKATDAIVESSALIAIDEEGYVPIGTPDFPEFDMASEGADYEYKFTLEVTPQMELESYDAVNIELPSTEPTEEQINSRIDTLREYYVTYEEPEEEGGEKVKKLPELTDAWVKETLEFDGVDDLKARVADSIRSNNEATHDTVKQYLVSAELANRLKGEPPAEMIEQTEKNNYQDMYRSLQARHTTLDAYLAEIGEDAKQFHEEMHDQAEQNTKEALALDALARHLKLGASEDEILDEFKKTGTADPEALMENWRQAGRLSEIREGILRMKASRHAIDTAVIHEPGTLEKEQEKETAKAAKSKSKAKAADKTADKADDWSDAKKPAAKKTTAKKPAAKKAADKDAKADKAPAKKKTAAKTAKTTKKEEA